LRKTLGADQDSAQRYEPCNVKSNRKSFHFYLWRKSLVIGADYI